jgi:hypothetical protein
MLQRWGAWSLAASLCLAPGLALAATVVYLDDLVGFEAAAGPLPLVGFDASSAPSPLPASIDGASLESPDGNSLEVLRGLDTVSFPEGDTDNRLFPTSSENVLSPGGSLLDTTTGSIGQRDSLRITFAQPVNAFGLDVLFQSLDGASYFGFEVRDTDGNLLASSGPIQIPTLGDGQDATSPSPRGGSVFLGFVSDLPEIARIELIETDDGFSNPDANVGYDSLRFVPEPSTALLLALGLAGTALGRLRSQRRRRHALLGNASRPRSRIPLRAAGPPAAAAGRRARGRGAGCGRPWIRLLPFVALALGLSLVAESSRASSVLQIDTPWNTTGPNTGSLGPVPVTATSANDRWNSSFVNDNTIYASTDSFGSLAQPLGTTGDLLDLHFLALQSDLLTLTFPDGVSNPVFYFAELDLQGASITVPSGGTTFTTSDARVSWNGDTLTVVTATPEGQSGADGAVQYAGAFGAESSFAFALVGGSPGSELVAVGVAGDPIPEPSTFLLVASGLVGMSLRRRGSSPVLREADCR